MSTKVEIGVMQKLLVTEVTENGQVIFVQLDTPDAYQVQDLCREIKTHISERNRDQVKFDPGSRCYACASDGVMYRALVVKCTTSTTTTVYFTDYGNSEEVENSNIFPPTGSYFDLPAQALCCTLSDFIPNRSEWTGTINEILAERLVNQEVYGIFRSLSSCPHPHSEAVLQDEGQYPSYNVTLFQDEAGVLSYSQMLVDLNLGQFAVCNENVKVGTTKKVFVAFADSPGRFWLQLSSCSTVLSFISEILHSDEIVPSLQPLPREAVFTGVACCVVFDEDGDLYRANVIEVKGQKVQVQFVDYGNSMTVTTSDILGLPPSLSVIPAQAIQCCLEGVRPLKKDWTPESCEAFTNGTINIEMDAQFVDELTPEVFTVILRNPETGLTISEMLVSSGCAQSSNPPSILGEPPHKKAAAIQQNLPKEFTPGKMEVGQTYKVAVTQVDSPSVMWAQIAAHEAVFRDMMKRMEGMFRDAGSIPGLAQPSPGQPCAVQFADDQKWYRGQIEAVDAATSRAKVLFVDFGNSDIVNITSLKQLQPELILLPTQAVSFSMFALVPAGGGKVWSLQTMSSFMKMTSSSGVFQCEVVKLDSDGYPAVQLRDGRGRDIGEELVKMGLAAWSSDERRSRSNQLSFSSRESSSSGRSGPRSSGSARGPISDRGGSRERRRSDRERNVSSPREERGRAAFRSEERIQGRESSTRGSGGTSRDGSTRGSTTGSRETSARGSRPPSLSSLHGPTQQPSPLHSKPLSPIHTGTGQPQSSQKTHYTSLKLEVGKSYEMMVVHVESLQDFYAQLKEHEVQLADLMDRISQHCDSNGARIPDNLEIGQPVLAQFTEDQGWYRATVVERNNGISKVMFVDYGNNDTLSDLSLVKTCPEFLSLPAQAIHCSLDGVGMQVSPETAKTAFNDITLEQEASGLVKGVLQDSSGPVYTVDLTLSDGSKPVTALVEGGHISIPKSTLSHLSPSSSPTLTEVKFPSFPTHTHVHVCLSYIESPTKFFVQLLDNFACLKELTQGMNEIYSKMSPSEEILFSLNEGVFCAARFSEDGVWYRARIVSVGGATVMVRFVDYGNEDVVPASDLKSLRVHFAAEACLAIQCHLDNLPPEILTSPQAVQRFIEFTTSGQQLVAEFLKPFSSYSESVPVRLFDTSLPDPEQDVAVLLRNVHFKALQPPSHDQPMAPPAVVKSGPTSSKTSLPPVKPVLKQPLECMVTHVSSPSEIYCQESKSTVLAEALLEQLYAFYVEQNLGERLDSFEIGTVCAAPFTDGSWYRVKISRVASKEQVSVHYIDYGNAAEVAVGDLRAIHLQFLSEPPHAMKCSLIGIRPIETQGEEWNPASCAALTEMLLDHSCTVFISAVSGEVCSAKITVADTDIAQRLISEGFAAACSTAQPTALPSGAAEKDTLAIPPFSAEVGTEIDVFVTFCDFPRVVYCQPSQIDPRFQQLTEKIENYCNSPTASVVSISDVIVDDVILAQYSEDQAWYRAQVIEILKDSLKVLFIDYGNCETTASLRAIPAKFCSLSAQAVPCSILNSQDFALTPEKGHVLNDSMTSDDSGFKLRFIEVSTTAKNCVVQLFSLSDGESVLEQACNAGLMVKRDQTLAKCREVVTTAKSFPPVVIEKNSREEGFVSHVESLSSFWVQLSFNEGDLAMLTERIAAVYKDADSITKLTCPDPQTGQACCAQFSEDVQWYRGTVKDVTAEGVRVHFLDYGNGEVVPLDRFRQLTEEFFEISPQAIHCSLIGITPSSGSTWSDESIDHFYNLVMEKALSVEFVGEMSKEMWSVKLTCENADVATAMINGGFAVSNSPSQMDCEQPVQISSGGPEKCSKEAPVIIPELTLNEGQTYEVYLSHMTDSPSEFYCQLMSSEDSLNHLMSSIADYYSDESSPPTVEVGSYCVAQYSGNNAWHRARIVGIEQGGASEQGGNERVVVQFVDFGNCESVSRSQIRGLVPALASTLPQQAVCCSLVDNSITSFPDDTIARFLEVNTEACYRVKVRGCLDNGRYLVDLIDFDGIVLSDHILNRAPVSPPLPSDASNLLFKKLSYPVTSTVDVYVSFVDSPTSFYCQPLELAADLDSMMQALSDAVVGGNLEKFETVSPGTPCLAQFSIDKDWYRAIVEGVSENGTEVVVHFVDYGNSEATSPSALLKCPARLFKEPIQALHCSVFDSRTTAGVEWNDNTIEAFRALLGDEALSLTVTEFVGESGLCVCTLSSNGHPIDFSSLLPSLDHESANFPVAPGDHRLIEDLASEPPYASSASSSSLPATAVTVTTAEVQPSDHSERPSENEGDASSGRGLISEADLGSSPGQMNFSTIAQKGSSQASCEELSDTESSEETSDQGGGEGEPLIKAPFTLTLSIPEEFDATVVYVESPSFLFIQRFDCQAELEKLSLEIEQYCASFAEKQHQEVFHQGDFVLARYSDGVWYRAKVVEVGPGAEFHVFFIDFGNSDSIPPDQMVMCPENYLELPCQAVACSLANVPRRDAWPEEYKKLIDDQVIERRVRVKVIHPASKGMRPAVNIEDSETGVDVSQAVLNYLHEECEQGNISNYVIPEEPEEDDEENLDDHEKVTPKVDTTAASDNPTKEKAEVKKSGSDSLVPKRELTIGSSYDAYVVACETPHSFFVQLSSEVGALEEMSSALESAYENTEISDLALPAPPAVGEYVCAQFSEDHKWYRARVVGFDAADPERAELLFIDYGNGETCELAHLRRLSHTLPAHPPLAVECFLAGVEPLHDQSSGFDSEASQRLLELTGHGDTECKVEVQFADSAGHYGVNLIGGEGVNVAQALFDAHLATELQDTPTTDTSSREVTFDQTEPVQPSGSVLTHTTISGQIEVSEDPLAVSDSTKIENESQQAAEDFAISYPSHSLAPGTTHGAVVTSISSLDDFQCQLTDKIDQLESLMEAIESRGYKVGDGGLTLAQLCKGQPVCACYTEENVWYRAEITNILSQTRVRVSYIDYGNSEEVDLARVRLLERELAEALLPLIVHCSLAPLTDRDLDSTLPPTREAWELIWPGECVNHFQELVGEEGEVSLVIEEVMGDEGEGVRVRVVVRGKEGEEVDVRQAIIARLLESQRLGREALAADEDDGGYGDSVTEEGGALKEVLYESSGSKGLVSSEARAFEQRLEEVVKEVASIAIAEAQHDMKLSENPPSFSRED